MYKISVIIPIYNTEPFLRLTFDRILEQTMNYKDIQVVAVNDCSSDKSQEIIDEYANKYNNFVSVKLDKPSGGAGTPRNEGLKYATGEYIMFTDSDDLYEKDSCEYMYNAIKEKNADFMTFNYRNMDPDGTPWETPIFDLEIYKNLKLDITDYDKSFFVMNSSVCNKIYNREFLMKHNIRCLEGVPSEDNYFVMSCFLCSDKENGKAYYDQHIIYNYRQREASFSTICDASFFKRTSIAHKELYRLFKSYDRLEFYRYYYAKNMSYILYRFIDSDKLTDDERVEILEEMRWYYALSEALNVPACQVSLSILLEKIIKRQYHDVIDICKIIYDIRKYVDKSNKYRMTKPTREMYQAISGLKIKSKPEV